MPTIRDGRGKLTVHDMGVPPPGSPSGPVERVVEPSVVDPRPPAPFPSNAERIAQAAHNSGAASRARGAERAGFVKGATKRGPKVPIHHDAGSLRARAQVDEGKSAQTEAARALVVATRNAALTSRQEQVVEALRRLGSRKAVMVELGAKHVQSIDGTLLDAHAKGLLPADLPDLPKRLQRALAGAKAPPRRGRPEAAAGVYAEHQAGIREALTVIMDRALGDQPDVIAPCGDCAHVEVCAIKALLDLAPWRERAAAATPFPAIRIVAISIDCSHYLATS